MVVLMILAVLAGGVMLAFRQVTGPAGIDPVRNIRSVGIMYQHAQICLSYRPLIQPTLSGIRQGAGQGGLRARPGARVRARRARRPGGGDRGELLPT